MKTCYLHLGLHKTASSSFQQTCAANIQALKQESLYYPIFSCPTAKPARLKINNHSVPLRSLYEQKPSEYHINKRWKIKDIDDANRLYQIQWDQALNSDSSIIISGEGISLLPVVALEYLLSAIKSQGFVLQAMALVRSPLDYAHSIAQQLIRGGQYLDVVGFGKLRQPTTMPRLVIPDGCREISKLLAVFGGTIRFTPFYSACQHPMGPVAYLLEELCGCKSVRDFSLKQTQESKSNLWVRYQNQLNSRWPRFDQKKRLNPDYLQIPDHYMSSGKFLLTRSEISLLQSQIDSSNVKMSGLLGDQFVMAQADVTEELTSQDLLDLMMGLAKRNP